MQRISPTSSPGRLAWFRLALVLAILPSHQLSASQPVTEKLPPVGNSTEQFAPRESDSRQQVSQPPKTGPGSELEIAPIDLPSALRLAGGQNQSLVIAFQRTLEATAIRQLAAAKLLPNLNGGTNFDGHSGALQQASGNILNVNRDALYVGAGANAVAAGSVSIPGVQYNLNVSDSIYNYLVARPNVERANIQTRTASNDLQREVALAYGELLRAEGLQAIIRRVRDDSSTVLGVTQAYARSGLGSQTEVERAMTELERREVLLQRANANVLSASAKLVELLYLQPTLRLHAAEPWVVPRSIVPDPIPLQELIATAMYQRPELAAQRAAVDSAMLSLQASRMLLFSPQVMLGYSAGNFGGGSNLVASSTPPVGAPLGSPRFGDFAARTDFDVVMYWTLQNFGFGNRALVERARARLRATDLERLAILNQVRAEVAEAYARKRTFEAMLDVRRQAVESGQLAFEQDLKRIRATNRALPIEVLDSLRLLGGAREEYLNAIVDYNESQFDLYWALGRPPGDLLVRPVSSNGPAPMGGNR